MNEFVTGSGKSRRLAKKSLHWLKTQEQIHFKILPQDYIQRPKILSSHLRKIFAIQLLSLGILSGALEVCRAAKKPFDIVHPGGFPHNHLIFQYKFTLAISFGNFQRMALMSFRISGVFRGVNIERCPPPSGHIDIELITNLIFASLVPKIVMRVFTNL